MNGIWDNGPTLDERTRNMNRYGHILAMRLLQSDLILDDEEIAARDYFLAMRKDQEG